MITVLTYYRLFLNEEASARAATKHPTAQLVKLYHQCRLNMT